MTDATSPADRRRYVRVRGPFDGTVDVGAEHGPIRVIDFTQAGCFVYAQTPVAPNERIRVTLHLPQTSSITISGRVVYVDNGRGFGAEFVDVPPGLHHELALAVTRLTA